MTGHVVFDLDGVLLDSNDIIRECYRLAGAQPPDDVLGAENTGWLTDQCGQDANTVRAKKNELYLDALSDRRIPVLPPFVVASLLHAYRWNMAVTTAAPPGSAQLFSQYYVRKPKIFSAVIDNIRVPDRMLWMAAAYGPRARGVYVDDQDRSDMLPVGWRFVQYTGQTDEELMSQIMDEEDA